VIRPPPRPALSGHWQIGRIPAMTGHTRSRHAPTKITAADVHAIRSAHADGQTITALAHTYAISPSYVAGIVSRRNWGHLG